MHARQWTYRSATAIVMGACGLMIGAGSALAVPGEPCGIQQPCPGPDGPAPGGNGPAGGLRQGPPQPGGPGAPGGPHGPGGPGGIPPIDPGHHGIDQGRLDHQPFMWQGQRVDPLPAGNGDGWGFWFLGQWIRL